MNFNFSIYDIFNVALYDVPARLHSFTFREYNYFKKDRLERTDLEIHFVDKILIPEGSILLAKGFYYKDGVAFLAKHGSILEIPLKDISSSRIRVVVEKNIIEWFVLYVIEKIMHLKVVEKGYCFFHSAGLVRDDKAVLYVGLQQAGKTEWILRQLKKDGEFLGDDLVLVDHGGNAYAYPRGVNVHVFHKNIYNQALKRKPWKRAMIGLLKMLLLIVPKNSWIADRLNVRIKEKFLLRMHINDLMPDVKIARKSQIEKILINLKARGSKVENRVWGKERVCRFLTTNTSIERSAFIDQFIPSFLAFGDEVSVSLGQYVKELLKKEVDVVSGILDSCQTDVVVIPNGSKGC